MRLRRPWSFICVLALPAVILAADVPARPELPIDLVGVVSASDDAAGNWLNDWQSQRPASAESVAKLKDILKAATIDSSTLCRVARQLDRCKDRPTAQAWAAAAIGQVTREFQAGQQPNASLVKAIGQLQPLLVGTPTDQDLLGQWADLVLHLPTALLAKTDLQQKAQQSLKDIRSYRDYAASPAATATRPSGAVDMPEDLLALVAGQDPDLLHWINLWQENRDGGKVTIHSPGDGLSQLDSILDKSSLSAMTLFRVARQFDRGRDWYAEVHTDAAVIRAAQKELKSGVIPDQSFAQMIWRVYTTLEEAGGRKMLGPWADIILSLPSKLVTNEMIATAHIAQLYDRVENQQFDDARDIATTIKTDFQDNPTLLKPPLQSQAFTLFARIKEHDNILSEALDNYKKAIQLNPGNGEATHQTICLLARLGHKEEALRLAADYIKRFDLNNPSLHSNRDQLFLDIQAALNHS
jgi:tetratricopeptide (TPR) repeat protein